MKKFIIISSLLFLLPFFGFAQLDDILSPSHAKIQYAGNIGFISAGVGYTFWNEKGQTDVLVGYLPKSIGGVRIISLTAKAAYYPWDIKVGKRYEIEPIYGGVYLSYSFGSQYYTSLPEYYPRGYYWWPTALRAGLFLGGRVNKDISFGPINRLGIYYEFGTYDLKFISVMSNLDYFSITDAFDLALGLRFKFK